VEVFEPASTRVRCEHIPMASRYVASGRNTAQKTHPLHSNGRPLLLHICWNMFTESLPSNGYMRTHIENTSCNTGSIVACLHCGSCPAMGLLHCWLHICCGLDHEVAAQQRVCASQYHPPPSLSLPSGPFPSGFPTNILYASSSSSNACYMPSPFHPF
jgi:hypothetical protein